MKNCESKQKIHVGILIFVVLALILVIYMSFFFKRGLEIGREEVWLMDTKTGDYWAVTSKEYKTMASKLTFENVGDPGKVYFENSKTGERTAVFAEKCEKCGNVFIPNYMNTKDYFDRCPSCGYSNYEELRSGKSDRE